MDKTSKIALAIIVAGLLIGGAFYFTNKEEKMLTIPLDKTDNGMSVYKDSFMEGCMEESATYSTCNCYYNSLLNQLGEDGLLEVSLNYAQTEQFPAEVLTKAVKDCLK
jgi:hypothetical protein